MDTNTYLRQINQEVEDFKAKNITIVPGLFFNQQDTIEKIHFYYNSKFTTGDIDEEGDKKYFYNIVKNPCKVFSKSVDFDTKNIRLLTTGGGDPTKTWFMERDLKFWMRDKQFGKILNRLFKELPIFGSVVLKIVNGMPEFVDLRNFVVEQSADTLDNSNYLVEIHYFTPASFRKVGQDMGWDEAKIKEAIELFHQMKGASHIKVYERYGEIKVGEDWKYKRIFIADVGNDEYDNRGNLVASRPGVLLKDDNFQGNPYWEFHAEKMPGRWLGIGVVESLFEPQIRQNELANIQAKTTYWAGLRLFQTRDAAINRNLFTDSRNGEVINSDSEITQIDMSDRNLSFFNEEYRKWLNNRDELTFSYDVVQGERLPAGTPLGSARLAIGQTLSYFEQIQEDIAMDVKEMLYRVIIPQFDKERTQEHTLRLVGDDLDTYIEMVKNDLTTKEIIRLIYRGKFPTNQDKKAIEVAIQESIKQNKEKILDVPKDYYKNLKYDVDIDITGESVDTRVRSATKFAILQAITADPTALSNPVKRKFLYSMAEDGGINPDDFFGVMPTEPQETMPQGAVGGGVSAPAMNNAMAGSQTQTI